MEPGDQLNNHGLDYSRPINLHTWSESGEAIALVDTINGSIFGQRRSKTRMKLLRIVLLELYLAWKADPEMNLSVSRDNSAYPLNRYNGLGVTKTIVSVLDILSEAGLIDHTIGFQDRFSGKSRRTRIRATDKLVSFFEAAKLGQAAIDRHHLEETVVLRIPDPKERRKQIEHEYDESGMTRRSRFILNVYNALLAKTEITHPGVDDFIELDPDKYGTTRRVHTSDKFVRRVFSGSLHEGGRFYGGWWQPCSKRLRIGIKIDGRPTIEVDYSGHMPAILYAEAGIDYWSQINADPYEVYDLPDGLAKVATREVCKKVMNIAINAPDAKVYEIFHSDWAPDAAERNIRKRDVMTILSNIKKKHLPIADRFGTGCGLAVMNTDGRITERIVSHFTRQTIPVLSIHDSYIVPVEHEAELRDLMQTAFQGVTGAKTVRLR